MKKIILVVVLFTSLTNYSQTELLWSNSTFEENNCLACHRLSNINAWNFENNTDWNLYMPPSNPGSMSIDYQAIKDYIQNLGPFEIDANGTNAPSCD